MTKEERFWAKVQKGDGCWEWTAARDKKGYGRFESHTAHRTAYALTYGEFPQEMSVLHRCDNPPCVNPAHLFLGTQDDNIKDMDTKGRRVSLVRRGELGPSAKLSKHDIPKIMELHRQGMFQKDISKKFGVGQSAISAVIRGQTWKDTPRGEP